MITRGLSDVGAAAVAWKTPPTPRQTFPAPLGAAADAADRVTLSDAARALLADAPPWVPTQREDSRLATIKAKPAVERTVEDTDYLLKHDARLAEIRAKGGPDKLTADELDYVQKAGGFVNTMAELSPQEKALYDELIAAGEQEAASAMALIALSRVGMGGRQVQLPNGRSFDPTTTEITADSVRNLYRFLFVDGDGHVDRVFEALAAYLERRQASAPAANPA